MEQKKKAAREKLQKGLPLLGFSHGKKGQVLGRIFQRLLWRTVIGRIGFTGPGAHAFMRARS